MKKLITERDLEHVAAGQSFHVEPQMLLTPSARDYASRHGISLVYPKRRGAVAEESAMDRAIRDIVTAELGRADRDVMRAVRKGMTELEQSPGPTPSVPDPPSVAAALQHEAERAQEGDRAVLSAMGINRTGILGQLTQAISNLGCDIKDVSQTIVSGYFTMILIVDLSGVPFDRFRDAMMRETSALGLEGMLMHEDVLKAMHRV